MARHPDAPETEQIRDIQRQRRRRLHEAQHEGWRPATRGDCEQVPRPCPYFGCRYNTTLELSPQGSIRWRLPNPYADDLEETPDVENCALDVAARGPQNLDQIGHVMGVCRERIRQEVNAAYLSLRPHLEDSALDDLDR